MKSKRVYITKYGLTEGILDCELLEHNEEKKWVSVRQDGLNNRAMYFHKDFHFTLDAARTRVVEMAKAKIRSLDNQLSKMIHLTQGVVPVVKVTVKK